MNKKTWHCIVEKCKCTRSEIYIVDNKGEDCNAYNEIAKYRQEATQCDCGITPKYKLIKTK